MKNHKSHSRVLATFVVIVALVSGGYLIVARSFAQDANVNADSKVTNSTTVNSNLALTDIENLKSVSSIDQESFLSSLDKDRHLQEEALILQLLSDDNQVQCMAAFLLGMNRHNGAVNSLVEQITLQDEQFPRPQTGVWFWDQYPALEALVKIGKPSTRALVTNIESNEEKLARDLSLRALRAIEGGDVAQFILEREMANQYEPSKKANLEAALAELKKEPQ